MTNFEKIKNMSVEEMADKLVTVFDCARCPARKFCAENKQIMECESVLKKWLKSDVKTKV